MFRVAIALLLIPTLAFSQVHLRPVAPSDIHIGGDLSHRILLNLSRLTDSYYKPDHLITISPDWPGDAAGREILALTLLAQSTGVESPNLPILLNAVSKHLNDHGYLGPVLAAGVENEQYLSGHSWLLRGLCEHYAWKHDDLSLSLIRKITVGLLLPATTNYSHYPIRPEDRPKQGHVAGNITHAVDGWQLSSDVGCAFIMLDGATQAAQLAPSPQLDALIREMIGRFAQVDLVKVAAQTHATLSALRGVLRFYESHPDPAYLDLVKRTYSLYFDTATTEHYANYNWFTRPEWTEACAVVDSYMLATQLYEITREAHYLEDAQLIYYNALSHAQRPNGGFGCDLCVGSNVTSLVLKPHDIYEAPFCCSMRGAEGLTVASSYSYLVGEPEIVFPNFHDNTATVKFPGSAVRLIESTSYPLAGSVRVTVAETTLAAPIDLRFFLPTWTPPGSVKITVNDVAVPVELKDSFVSLTRQFATGDQIALNFDVPDRTAPALHPALLPGHRRSFHGPLLMGRSPASSTQPAVPAAIRDFTYLPKEKSPMGQELLFKP